MGTGFSGQRRWLCRRGTRELEVLLERTAPDWDELFTDGDEQQALADLLAMQDPELYDLLTGRVIPGDAVLRSVCLKLSPHLDYDEETRA